MPTPRPVPQLRDQSPSMYYYAPTNDAASRGVFRAIGGQLANLHIVE